MLQTLTTYTVSRVQHFFNFILNFVLYTTFTNPLMDLANYSVTYCVVSSSDYHVISDDVHIMYVTKWFLVTLLPHLISQMTCGGISFYLMGHYTYTYMVIPL